MSRNITLLVCLGILLAGGLLILLIFNTEPEAAQAGASKETAMLVNVTEAEKGRFTPVISAMGTVRASQEIMLQPRINGEVMALSENFSPGGYVQKGEVMLRIDPADYQNTLARRRSELQQAQTDLMVEQGRQNVARQDYEVLGDSLPGQNRALVLREPQLDAARARVEAAEAAVEQAQLELDRTTLRAPFDAYILSRNANVGSQVGPGDTIAELVGTQTYWVEATVPQRSLRWIEMPENGQSGKPVHIRNRSAWPEGSTRTGELYRLIGSVDGQTRLARLLISVDDPHGQEDAEMPKERMILGSFVEAQIPGRELENVVRINRDYIRENDTVWLMESDSLRIEEADIVFEDEEFAYVRDGVQEGERIITTNLATVVEGAALRLEDSENTAYQPE
ncbi:MAG: efflux RND transporter periplasmic adaptor subunit [Cyclonatronaceae bacterium]